MVKELKFAFCFIFLLINCVDSATQSTNQITHVKEGAYGSPDDLTLPLWARKMYDKTSNVGEVINLYNEYYLANEFVKNEHTQFYKRWLRNIKEVVDDKGYVNPPLKSEKDRIDQARIRAIEKSSGPNRYMPNMPNWVPIGPFDFDKDAAGRSHAPGAAHVYTIEKAPSNPDILFCGTATAGIWKTTDRGLNWYNVSPTIPVNHCNAIEIHPTNPDIVWIGGNDRLYQTTNGGITWTQVGDAAFNLLSHSIDDIALKPGTADILFVASDKGLFRSENGGATFIKLISPKSIDSYFGEIEFKPDDPNTIYVILNGVNNIYTEFYKSIDGGNTFSIVSSWPVLTSVYNLTYTNITKSASSNQYATFLNDSLGTSAYPNFTIEMRIKVPNDIADKVILSNKNYSNGTNKGWMIGSRSTGELRFNIGDGTSRIDLNAPAIWDDNWHQVSAVYRSTGQKELYVDGVLKATSTSNITLNANAGLPMILGRDGNLGFGAIDVQIDEFRIWKEALSSTDINNWQFNEVDISHPSYTNLLHYYKCNETSGNTITDELNTNNGTMNNGWNRSVSLANISSSNLPANDHQKRAEIAVTAADPNRIYALLAGAAYGGTGLFGIYESNDAGETWTHKCCGTGPGGSATSSGVDGMTTTGTNPNILGYNERGSDNGGQYYYDLALDADPGNANKIHIGGINHWYSTDAGSSFKMPAKWSWPDNPGYVHADIHNIKIFGNEVWIVNDGGIFMSQDSGKVVFNKRQYGIAGTDFWGFGMGHKDADVMLGGTYHNSHLMKNNNVYINGWTSYTGSADGTRGFVNPGKEKTVYNDSGKDVLPAIRTQNVQRFSFDKKPNTQPVSKIAWDPRCYNCLYTGNGSVLWYSADDGVTWSAIKDFAPNLVGDIEVGWDDPNIIWVTVANGTYDPKYIWKSTDKGATWSNVTPNHSLLGYNSSMWFNITLGDNNQHVWMNVYHRYGWNSSNANKIFYSSDGGSSWTNISSAALNNQNIEDVAHQRGSNGGVYVGTNKSVYYKDHSLPSFIPFATGLPLSISTTRLPIWYKEGKIRLASNQSVWESPLYSIATPKAQPMADKLVAKCPLDTFYFKDYSAHYKKDATFLWSFSPTPAYVSSTTSEAPKVVFDNSGNYSVSLTVTDSAGTSTKAIFGGITVNPETCNGVDDNCNGQIDEAYSLIVASNEDSGTNTLRQILSCAQHNDTIRFNANIDTITLIAPLQFSKNVVLMDEIGDKVVLKMDLNASGFIGAQAGILIQTGTILKMENLSFQHINNNSSMPVLQNHGHLKMKNCSLNGNPKTIIQHSPTSSFTIEGIVEIK